MAEGRILAVKIDGKLFDNDRLYEALRNPKNHVRIYFYL